MSAIARAVGMHPREAWSSYLVRICNQNSGKLGRSRCAAGAHPLPQLTGRRVVAIPGRHEGLAV